MSNDHLYMFDNPVWYALKSVHEDFAIVYEKVQRYPSHVLPFISFDHGAEQTLISIENLIEKDEKAIIIGDLPKLSSSWSVSSASDYVQMICRSPIAFTAKEYHEIIQLPTSDADEMVEFVNSIQPGYFKNGTPLLGNYYGIKIDGMLIATAGERLKMNGYTEISAVCTHPEFTGKGFAQYLIAHLCNQIKKSGELPFLHVLNTNFRAISLYEFLGFEKRRNITFHEVSLSGL
ncbi:GNAT family N-acetyltransferase [Pedobacter sp. PAMC26386]|nr:GNAT family N-acetyltransferase [Pedobacter sp. PAMC26386]